MGNGSGVNRGEKPIWKYSLVRALPDAVPHHWAGSEPPAGVGLLAGYAWRSVQLVITVVGSDLIPNRRLGTVKHLLNELIVEVECSFLETQSL
jgi:hypothetical protein